MQKKCLREGESERTERGEKGGDRENSREKSGHFDHRMTGKQYQ